MPSKKQVSNSLRRMVEDPESVCERPNVRPPIVSNCRSEKSPRDVSRAAVHAMRKRQEFNSSQKTAEDPACGCATDWSIFPTLLLEPTRKGRPAKPSCAETQYRAQFRRRYGQARPLI
jgi:hypothetical protein